MASCEGPFFFSINVPSSIDLLAASFKDPFIVVVSVVGNRGNATFSSCSSANESNEILLIIHKLSNELAGKRHSAGKIVVYFTGGCGWMWMRGRPEDGCCGTEKDFKSHCAEV